MASQKVNSLIADLANFEEYGIKEQEFSQLTKSSPIYTITQFGKFFNQDDLSEILTLKRYKEVLNEIKTKKPTIKLVKCLLRLHPEDLIQGNL